MKVSELIEVLQALEHQDWEVKCYDDGPDQKYTSTYIVDLKDFYEIGVP